MRIRTTVMALAAAALLAGTLTAVLDGPAAAAPGPACGWKHVPAPQTVKEFHSVDALAGDDVRFGGELGQVGVTQRWDGKSMTESRKVLYFPASDTAINPTWSTFGSADEGWMLFAPVGIPVVAARWHGNRWTVVPTAVSPEPATKIVQLGSVATVSATDAWAFGYLALRSAVREPSNTVIEHWDGTSWSMVANPTQDMPDTVLKEATVVSPSDIWAVGSQSDANGHISPLVEHWDGARWQVVDAPAGNGGAGLERVSASAPDDIWAAGDQTLAGSDNLAAPLVEHWDGTRWTEVRTPPELGNAKANSVYASPQGDVWVIVQRPAGRDRFLHWDGKAWSVVPAPGPLAVGLYYDFEDISGSSSDDIWAVGNVQNNATKTVSAQIAHYTCGGR